MDQITLENVYPLNPRQEALLLEAGYAPDAKELTEIWNFVLRGGDLGLSFVRRANDSDGTDSHGILKRNDLLLCAMDG